MPTKMSQSDKLIALATSDDVFLFQDELGQPYAQIVVGTHKEIVRIRSRNFKHWLARRLWEADGKAPYTEALTSAIQVIEGKALFDGKRLSLDNRVASYEGAIWYDLSDEGWRAVRISPDLWEIINDPPILFRRYAHQAAQIEPNQEGNAKQLLNFINVKDDSQRLLLVVYAVSCLIPDIPHPIPSFYGAQGAAKSTAMRVLRRLIDPSKVELLSFPPNANELIQKLSHHWCPFFDNLSSLPDWVSDALCRASTGEGFTKRKLYSDDEDIIYSFRRCIALNGINLPARKPDLLDRSILVGLERVPPESRREEAAFWDDFEKARPALLGGMFTALSKAMRLRPEVRLSSLPRMADFALWGCAIAEALGYSREEFIGAYLSNIGEQNQNAIHENPVAEALSIFMESKGEHWEGSATELLELLKALPDVDSLAKGWPRSPNSLTRRINEVKTNLADAGITVSTEKRGSRRFIVVRKITKIPSLSSLPLHVKVM